MDPAFSNLRPDMTVEELPSERCQVSPETRGQEVLELFNARHGLPGIIVASGDTMDVVISRTRFMELLSRPFGIDLCKNRPIRLLLDTVGCMPLILPGNLSVHEGARAALERPTDAVFEPIVVVSSTQPNSWRLLDVHTLLLAQSGLLQLANEMVERQRAAAEAANHAKSQFLANMSHEIRTPLTAIIGFAENLLDPALHETDRRNAIKTVVRNGEHLLEIINDILDLSKIEAGKFDVERLSFSPARLVADVVSVMRVRADARRLPLTLSWRTPIPELIQSDPTRLRQILINLLGNAIKFTHEGSVELRVEFDRHSTEQPRLVFSIVDTGIGMDEAHLSRLFKPFSQADQSMARRFGGTGLGLAISQRLAGMLGGDIIVESRLGQGTTFRVDVATGPLDGVRMLDDPGEALQSESEAVEESAPETIACRILLAEDSPDNRLLISTFLRKSGAEVALATNGQEALDTGLESHRSGRPFDVILMDIQMPVLDGYEATRRLRAAGYAAPIIALTANAMRGDQQQCYDAGCNDYATKPINRGQLLSQIARQVSNQTAPSVIDVPSGQPIGSMKAAEEDFENSAPDNVLPPLDREVALSRTGGDFELLKDLGRILLESGPEWIAQLEEAHDSGDLKTLRRLAHTMKSAADNVGGHAMNEAAAQLEALAAEGKSGELHEVHAKVVKEWQRLIEAVEDLVAATV